MEKETMIISCKEMLPPRSIEELKKSYNIIVIDCVPDLGSIQFPEGKIIYVLGGQERLFGVIAVIVADIAKKIIFLGEQPETYVDIPFFEANGIPVVKTGGGAISVGREVIKIIADPHRLRDWATRHRNWAPPHNEDVVETMLKEQTVSIIGAGKIGGYIIEQLAGRVGKLIYAGGRGPKKEMDKLAQYVDNENIDKAFRADVVSVHLSYGRETEEIIKATYLNNIFPWGCYINYARAELNSLNGLSKIMEDRPDLNFYFDVFWKEGESFKSLTPELDVFTQIPNFHYWHHSAIIGDDYIRRLTTNEYYRGLLEILTNLQSK